MPVDGPLYPVNLVLAGGRCLVVGGGRVAATKVAGLVECRRRVDVVAPEIDEAIAADDAGDLPPPPVPSRLTSTAAGW